jgi:hypothetical protein
MYSATHLPEPELFRDHDFNKEQWVKAFDEIDPAFYAVQIYLEHRCENKNWKEGQFTKAGSQMAEEVRSASQWHFASMNNFRVSCRYSVRV